MADQPNAFEEQEPQTPETPVEDNKQEATPPAQNPQEPTDAFADKLKSIVNEDGQPKYDSVEKALEALRHSQEYIPSLKGEVETYKEKVERLQQELEKRESVEQVVERLTGKKQDASPSDPADPPQVSGLDEQAAKQLFEDMLTQRQQEESIQRNREQVNTALYEMYGEKTQEQVKRKADELGTSPKELGELASKNPNMVLALFKSSAPDKGPKPTTSSVNMHRYKDDSNETPKPDRSMLSGATSAQQREYMRQLREHTWKKHGVTG